MDRAEAPARKAKPRPPGPNGRSRHRASAPAPERALLAFLAIPVVVAAIAIALMTHVVWSSAANLGLSEASGNLRAATAGLRVHMDDAIERHVLDAADLARDAAVLDDAMRVIASPRRSRELLASGAGAGARRDLARLEHDWAVLRGTLEAAADSAVAPEQRGSIAAAVAALRPEFLAASEWVARDIEHFSRDQEDDHLERIGVLLAVQVLALFAGAAIKLLDGRRMRRDRRELQRLSLVARHTASGVVIADPGGRVQWANEAFFRLTGRDGQVVEGLPACDLLCGGAAGTSSRGELGLALATGGAHEGEFELVRRDGSRFWAAVELVPVLDPDGAVSQVLLQFADVTARVRATHDLHASEVRFRSALDSLNEGLILHDADGRIFECNRAAEQLLGAPRAALLGRMPDDPRWDVVDDHGRPLPPAENPVRVTLRRGHPAADVVVGLRTGSGGTRWLSVGTSFFDLPGIAGRGVVCTLIDVTERRRSERALQVLRQVVDDSPSIVLIADEQFHIEYVNSVFVERTGYAIEDVRGRTSDLLLAQPAGEPGSQREQAMRAGRPWRGEVRMRSRSGEDWLADWLAFPLRGPDGEVTHTVGILRDITEQRRREEELERTRAQALAAARAKSEFLQNMSHELRTPLNGILGTSELMLESPLDAGQRADLLQIRRSAEDLLAVITHLFDFVRVESGQRERESTPFRLRGSLREIERGLALGAAARGLAWRVEVDPLVPDALVGDPGAIRQVLSILASNAVKFTEQGEVALIVGLDGEDGERARIRFEMRDTGIGIPRERQVEIFEAFSQIDGSTTRRYGGIGLGLALASRIVRQMGGHLAVTSQPDVGSKFTFSLALARGAESAGTPGSDGMAAAVPLPLAGARVLVVAPAGPRITTRLALERAGASVESAADVPSARERLAAVAPDAWRAVVLDARSGPLDGFDLAAALRQGADALPPLLLFTSAGRHGDAERCREEGIAAYLSAPASEADLVDALRFLRPAANATPLPLVTRHLVREALEPRHVLLVDDNAVNRKVAARLLERAGWRVTLAADGREALARFGDSAFDAVLMDVQMPGMDGLEATRRIRAIEAGTGVPRTPILALTAHTLDSDRDAVIAAGMDDLVAKPIQPDVLLPALTRHLPAATHPAPPEVGEVLDWDEALARVDGDVRVLEPLLRLFEADAPHALERLDAACRSGDAPRVQRVAHGLRVAAGAISARRTAQLAESVETAAREGRDAEAAAASAELGAEVWRVLRALQGRPPASAAA